MLQSEMCDVTLDKIHHLNSAMPHSNRYGFEEEVVQDFGPEDT